MAFLNQETSEERETPEFRDCVANLMEEEWDADTARFRCWNHLKPTSTTDDTMKSDATPHQLTEQSPRDIGRTTRHTIVASEPDATPHQMQSQVSADDPLGKRYTSPISRASKPDVTPHQMIVTTEPAPNNLTLLDTTPTLETFPRTSTPHKSPPPSSTDWDADLLDKLVDDDAAVVPARQYVVDNNDDANEDANEDDGCD